jgi:hypothetical protein
VNRCTSIPEPENCIGSASKTNPACLPADRADPALVVLSRDQVDVFGRSRRAVHSQRECAAQRVLDARSIECAHQRNEFAVDIDHPGQNTPGGAPSR